LIEIESRYGRRNHILPGSDCRMPSEESDHGHRGPLLPPRPERPRDRRTAKQRDELAPPHAE
jgi:hypothetical protein